MPPRRAPTQLPSADASGALAANCPPTSGGAKAGAAAAAAAAQAGGRCQGRRSGKRRGQQAGRWRECRCCRERRQLQAGRFGQYARQLSGRGRQSQGWSGRRGSQACPPRRPLSPPSPRPSLRRVRRNPGEAAAKVAPTGNGAAAQQPRRTTLLPLARKSRRRRAARRPAKGKGDKGCTSGEAGCEVNAGGGNGGWGRFRRRRPVRSAMTAVLRARAATEMPVSHSRRSRRVSPAAPSAPRR